MKKVFIAILALSLTGCTENQMARKFGGTETVTLDPGQRLVNVTWKETSLWILTKQDTTSPSTYQFKEKSSFGLVDGTVTIIETK